MINPVAPVEGHYALLRNGMVARPMLDHWPENPPYFDAYLEIYWYRDGTAQPATKAEMDARHAPKYDIIATISPEAMALAAVTADGIDITQDGPTDTVTIDPMPGELERLRAALKVADSALSNALFVIRKQGVMPNGSWENGFNKDHQVIKAALEGGTV